MIKTVVITGATGILGNLVAKTFAARGHNIALLDRDQIKLDALVGDLNLPNERLYTQTIDLLNGPAVHDSAEAVLSKLEKKDISPKISPFFNSFKTFASALLFI